MKREKKSKKTENELMLLFRLHNLKISSDHGCVDQGFPKIYAQLAALNYAKQVENGYQITDLGRAFLKTDENKKLLRKI